MNRGAKVLRTPTVVAVVAAICSMLLLATLSCAGGGTATTTPASSSVTTTAGTEQSPSSYTTKTNPFTAIKSTTSTAANAAGSSTTTAASESQGSSTSTSGTNSSPTTQASTTTTQASTTTSVSTATTAAGEIALRVTGSSGDRSFTMAQLKGMAPTQGYGGFKNKLGNITAPAPWEGVTVVGLLDTVGGLSSGNQVDVIASDGYVLTFSYSQVAQGDFVAYDPSTGIETTQFSGPLRMIVAYAMSGNALGSNEGPLRLALVSPEADQVTTSSNWVKRVTQIVVK